MTQVYKLADRNGRTRDGTQWGEGVTHSAQAGGTTLCTDQVVHAYRSLNLAVMMDPVHRAFGPSAVAFQAEGEVVVDDGTKVGVKTLTTTSKVQLPEVTISQRVAFGILASLSVYRDPEYLEWAQNWLNGTDRSANAAHAAANAAGRHNIDLVRIANEAMEY